MFALHQSGCNACIQVGSTYKVCERLVRFKLDAGHDHWASSIFQQSCSQRRSSKASPKPQTSYNFAIPTTDAQHLIRDYGRTARWVLQRAGGTNVRALQNLRPNDGSQQLVVEALETEKKKRQLTRAQTLDKSGKRIHGDQGRAVAEAKMEVDKI